MMYPRLKLARNLLTDDGVIFISIDDNEQENLKKICDEIFGEENFITYFIWSCSTAGGIRPKFASKTHEYVLCYTKNKELTQQFISSLSEGALKMYNEKDEKGIFRSKDFVFKNKSTNVNQKYGIVCPDEEVVYPKEGYIYRFIEETFQKAKEENLVVYKKTGTSPLITKDGKKANWNIYIKKYLGDGEGVPSTIIPKEFASIYNIGTQLVQEIFLGKRVFENVKPINFINFFLKMIFTKESYILDFFSGSATTAHAVMQLNAEDGGNRKYIMVQLPEVCDEKSEAYKAGYKNICEIGKERIRRAGEKIKSDETLPAENREKLDIGFKVFKLDSSNIKEWDSETEDLKQSLFDSIDNIKSDRTSLDILYEILLKYGLDLNVPIVENKHFYSIGGGTLLINLDKEIDMEVIDSICEEYKTLLEIDEDFKTTVVLRDSSFANDVDKTNAMKKLEQVGIKEVRSI